MDRMEEVDSFGMRDRDSMRAEETRRRVECGDDRNRWNRGNEKNIRGRSSRKNRQRMLYGCFLLFFVLLVVCLAGTVALYQRGGERSVPAITVSLDSLDSPYAVQIDVSTGRVIGSKRSDEKIFPASMTKIMTVLVAIENIKNLDATITMSYDYFDALYAADATRAGYEPGEEAVIRDLLYGAMLPSGADCCMELAIQAAGSEEAFAELMNEKAGELGLEQTQFTNCTGLHDEEQYTTVYEMALILREALQNSTFSTVFTAHSHMMAASAVHPDGFTVTSSLFKSLDDTSVTGGEILGGKTGYTGEAGHCLASLAEIYGKKYIQVTAGWAADPRTELYHVNDAIIGYNLLGEALTE